MTIFPQEFYSKKIWVQLLIGIIFGLLNRSTTWFFTEVIKTPLFMDCIWTCAASFLGGICGFTCSLIYHGSWCLIQLIKYGTVYLDFLFSICSLTLVFIVRKFCKKHISVWSLIFIIFLLTIAISIEGGILVSLLYNSDKFILSHNVDVALSDIFHNTANILVAAIITRIPINFIDKTIAVIVAFLIILGLNAIFNKKRIK